MNAPKKFASQADLRKRTSPSSRLSEHAWAYTAEGDPNTGIVIGDDAVLVADTQATPAMAQDVIRRIREVTDKPIRYVVLTHYHAVRVLGASAYGAQQVIASQDTYDLIVERGEADKASEIGRFPRLFNNVESVPPGMTWPTMTFTGKMTLWLGKLEVQLLQLGRGHTKGDTVVWLPQERTLLSRRPGGVRRHALRRRRLLQGLAADARERRRAQAARARAGPRPRVEGRGPGGRRPAFDGAASSPTCAPASRPASPRART